MRVASVPPSVIRWPSTEERLGPVKACNPALCFWMREVAGRAQREPAPMPDSLAALVAAWWETVVAGEADEPHPIHGEQLLVRLRGDKLTLAGELDSWADRDELVGQARDRIGRGFSQIDAGRLKVARRKEKSGVLDQTVIAAFPNRETAALALKFVLERSRIKPKREAILAPGDSLSARAIRGFEEDIRHHLEKDRIVLVLEVDETAVFRVRALLEEDTRSVWTIATPPRVADV